MNNVNTKDCIFRFRNCLRRIARNDETEFSNHSVINAMEKFVKSINAMDETILIPCRLMDMKVGDEQDQEPKQNQKGKHTVNNLLNSTDLHDIYTMLNGIKANLLWGQGQEESANATLQGAQAPSAQPNSTQTASAPKGHIRRPSTVSVTSTNSSASSISDTESETGNENDSGIEENNQTEERTQQVAENFRRHLHGLTRSLRQMTEAAHYITMRYQQDIGSPI